MKHNALGRIIPETVPGYGNLRAFDTESAAMAAKGETKTRKPDRKSVV